MKPRITHFNSCLLSHSFLDSNSRMQDCWVKSTFFMLNNYLWLFLNPFWSSILYPFLAACLYLFPFELASIWLIWLAMMEPFSNISEHPSLFYAKFVHKYSKIGTHTCKSYACNLYFSQQQIYISSIVWIPIYFEENQFSCHHILLCASSSYTSGNIHFHILCRQQAFNW